MSQDRRIAKTVRRKACTQTLNPLAGSCLEKEAENPVGEEHNLDESHLPGTVPGDSVRALQRFRMNEDFGGFRY
jgi:hypothetical protein